MQSRLSKLSNHEPLQCVEEDTLHLASDPAHEHDVAKSAIHFY